MQRQQCLEDGGQALGGTGQTQVRGDVAVAGLELAGGDFAWQGAGGWCFQITEASRVDAGIGQRLGQQRAAAAMGLGANDAVDAVAIAQGIGAAFEHEGDGALAVAEALDRRAGQQVADVAAEVDGADEGEVEFAAGEAVDGGAQGRQTGVFVRGERQAGPAEAVLAGQAMGDQAAQSTEHAVGVEGRRGSGAELADPSGQGGLVQVQVELAVPACGPFRHVPAQLVVGGVEVEADAGKEAAIVGLGPLEAGVEERLAANEHQECLLGQHFGQLEWRDAEGADRQFEAAEEMAGRCRQAPGVGGAGIRHGGGADEMFGQGAQAAPGTETAAQADDGDLAVRLGRARCRLGPGVRAVLTDQQVGVGAAETEGRDGGATAAGARGPGEGFAQDAEGAVFEAELGGGRLEIAGGWQLPGLHGQQDLHQRSGAGGGEQVANRALDAADHAVVAGGHIGPELAQALELDEVAERGAGGVALDQFRCPDGPAGLAVGRAHGAQLALAAGRQQAAIGVVGKAQALDHGIDAVAVGKGVGQALEHENAGALADDQTVGACVERRGQAGLGERAQLGETHLRVKAIGPAETAAEDDVQATGAQLLDGEFEGEQGRGAGGVQGIALATETERLGDDPRRQCGRAAVPGVKRGGRGLRRLAADGGIEGAAEPVARQRRGVLSGQDDIAEDHAGAVLARLGHDRVAPGLGGGVEGQFEQGVELGDEFGFDRQTGVVQRQGFVVDETAVDAGDLVGCGLAGRVDGVDRHP